MRKTKKHNAKSFNEADNITQLGWEMTLQDIEKLHEALAMVQKHELVRNSHYGIIARMRATLASHLKPQK